MPVYQELISFDDMIHKLQQEPIIINDLPNTSETDKDFIKNLISKRYTSDMITLLPSCRCGETKGEFLAKTKDSPGVKCPKCGTYVTSSVTDDIEPIIWFRKPQGVHKLISPIILIILNQFFKKSGFSIIQWIIDTAYRPQVRQPVVIDKILSLGIQRGYNNFVDNFDDIINTLCMLKDFNKKKEIDYLKDLIKRDRHKIFSDYIPLPNKSILVIEKTNLGVYVDPIIVDAVDAIQTLVSIDRDFHLQFSRSKENRTARALCRLAGFYEKYFRSSVSVKTGQMRRHIFGTRTNFSYRAVISSVTDQHNYKELYVPWCVGLTTFRFHLMNKLFKLGMKRNDALGLILSHIDKYHPMLDKLLDELVEESGDEIWTILQRNPSLLQGSALCLKVKFKKDPNDKTIGISILNVKHPNADFDGKRWVAVIKLL